MPIESIADHLAMAGALARALTVANTGVSAEIIETHISTVILSGDFAYKLKKPLALGFLDFSTLAARQRCCEDELRLNRRTARSLYLGVTPITGTPAEPQLDGTGPVLDYAVRMRRFDSRATLDHLLARNGLTSGCIDDLAIAVASFHEAISRAGPGGARGTAEAVDAAARDNFVHIARLDPAATAAAALGELKQWTTRTGLRLADVFARRLATGCVRECHGDLHLGNVALIEGQPVLFDCIEFSEDFRWVDVMNEVAFMVMDLVDHARRDLAFRFLNRYLERTGDYDGIAVLRYYLVYRAMVRAKVALIRARQPDAAPPVIEAALAGFVDYVNLAATFIRARRPALLATTGVSGSGKTTASQAVLETVGAVRLRSDVERKRLAGMRAEARSDSVLASGLYGRDSTLSTYARLDRLAQAMLPAGFPVIIDATCLQYAERERFRASARSAGAEYILIACEGAPAVFAERIRARSARGEDASEATEEVLRQQVDTREPLTVAERAEAVIYDSSAPGARESLISEIGARLAT